AGFDGQDRAVVEANAADGHVFDRVSLVIPVRPDAAHFAGLVAVIGPGLAGSSNWPRRADAVMRRLDDVHADVDHRSATLKLLAAEDAPVGNSAPAKRLAADIHDFPQLSTGDVIAHELRLRAESILKPDDELF